MKKITCINIDECTKEIMLIKKQDKISLISFGSLLFGTVLFFLIFFSCIIFGII